MLFLVLLFSKQKRLSTILIPDWIPLTINDFDMLSEDDFRYFFDPESSFGTNSIEVIDAVMTEHVFEHLNVVDAIYALKIIAQVFKNDVIKC